MQPPSQQLPLFDFLIRLWRYRDGHDLPVAGAAVPLGAAGGGRPHHPPRRHGDHHGALRSRAVPASSSRQYKVTHSQLVPTMFSRMLKLPEEVRRRYDLSSLEIVVHAAAPCPVPVKEQMIEWWGPIIHEYYGATEGHGLHRLRQRRMAGAPRHRRARCCSASCTSSTTQCSRARRARPARSGSRPRRRSSTSTIRRRRRRRARRDGTMSTVGDVGYVDDDGYLYLTDRATFMIISGGVNIYPQECENLLITHPKVADAAVFGVPNEDLGEEVKAVVQPMPGVAPGPELARRADRVLRRAPRAAEVPALDRLRGRAAAAADRQALQARAARPLLEGAQETDRLELWPRIEPCRNFMTPRKRARRRCANASSSRECRSTSRGR